MQPRKEGHRYIETILKYYQGCNTADVDIMMSTFTDDVVHYFVDHREVRSARGLADYWARVGPLTQANWALDHTVIQEPEAVIEWSMRWVPRQTGKPELLRGSEWSSGLVVRYGVACRGRVGRGESGRTSTGWVG